MLGGVGGWGLLEMEQESPRSRSEWPAGVSTSDSCTDGHRRVGSPGAGSQNCEQIEF